MKLEEALQDSGLAEAWYDHYTVVVARESDGYKLTVRQSEHLPLLAREGLTLEQVESEVRTLRKGHTTDWSPVDIEG